MKTVVEDGGPCRKIMHVNAEPGDLQQEYSDTVDLYAKAGKVPGFRPGRAPRGVIERHYEKSIAEDVKDRLVPRFYRDGLKEQGITPVAIVSVSDVQFGKQEGLQFSVTLDVAPDFSLPKYKRIPLKRESTKVDDALIDDTLNGMRERMARYEAVEGRGVAEGDLVKVDYAATCDDRPLTELAPADAALGEAKDFLVMIGPQEFLPGFSAGLTGAAVGESRDITVHFPEDFQIKEVAGKDALYAVTVNEIRGRVLPEIDEEFLKQCQVETSEALREKVGGELLEAAEKRETDRLKDEIGKFLQSKTKFDLPQTVVEQEKEIAVRNIVQQIVMSGATEEQLKEQRDAIFSAAEQSSVERIRRSYILSRIADKEKIEIAEKEVDQRIALMAEQHRMTPERLRAELEKRNSIEGLRSDIRADKTLDFLLAEAKVKT